MTLDPLREEADIIYRLSRLPSRWCALCAKFTDHFAEFHKDDDDIAESGFVKASLAEARARLSVSEKEEK